VSNNEIARRTEIAVKIGGADVSADINKYLLSFNYSDSEEDEADDLRIELEDRETDWLNWFKTVSEGSVPCESDTKTVPVSSGELKTGDMVHFKGGHHYVSSVATVSANHTPRKAGTAKITNIAKGALHPIHLIGETSNVYGWVDENLIELAFTADDAPKHKISGDFKGVKISAVIIQKNWESDGKDRVLDCGVFEVDDIDAAGGGGQASRVTIKATALPHSSTVRTERKTKAWENIKLSAIASEIANKNSLKSMFLAAFDPLYSRREQIQTSDIVFLQGLCKNAGISLKVTAGVIVLFDEADFEKKESVRKIKRGESDIKTYRFSTSSNDTNYSKCRVSYTDPASGQTIEYTYVPSDSIPDNPTLEINEKVETVEEARRLAMNRLRQKNKTEYKANFTLVGDAGLVAGVTAQVSNLR